MCIFGDFFPNFFSERSPSFPLEGSLLIPSGAQTKVSPEILSRITSKGSPKNNVKVFAGNSCNRIFFPFFSSAAHPRIVSTEMLSKVCQIIHTEISLGISIQSPLGIPYDGRTIRSSSVNPFMPSSGKFSGRPSEMLLEVSSEITPRTTYFRNSSKKSFQKFLQELFR